MSANGKNDGAIAYMAGHSVAANLIMLLCLVGGLFAVRHITQEVFPDIVPDQVIVTVPYPGASPSEVERGIVLAVEEAVRGLDSVDKVTSTASEGSGRVVVEMVEGGDLQKLAQDVRNEVDRITTLPEDAEEPRVEILSRRREVIDLLVYGDAEEIVLREIAEQVRERLLQDPNITQIDLSGVRSPEIRIEISQETSGVMASPWPRWRSGCARPRWKSRPAESRPRAGKSWCGSRNGGTGAGSSPGPPSSAPPTAPNSC